MKFSCNLVCDKGYWFIELPFNAGIIDLGSSIDECIDMSTELKIINYLENGLSPHDIWKEGDTYLERNEIAEKIKEIKKLDDAISEHSEVKK